MELAKFMEIMALVMAGVFFLVGAYGVYTGICSVLAGGYADNIFFGAFMAIAFPIVCLVVYLCLRSMERQE